MRAYGIHPTHRLRLLASNAVVMHNGLVFEVYGIFVHKKTAPLWVGWGCPTFGVQFSSDGLELFYHQNPEKQAGEDARVPRAHTLHAGYACYDVYSTHRLRLLHLRKLFIYINNHTI